MPVSEMDVEAALALLAQLAQFNHTVPDLTAQPSDSTAPGAIDGVAGAGELQALTGNIADQLRLDMKALQALLGRNPAETVQTEAQMGMTDPGHLPLGQPLPPEAMAELRGLQQHVANLQQQLTELLKEHGQPAVVLPSDNESTDNVPAAPAEASIPVPAAPMPSPALAPAAPAPAESAPSDKAPADPVQAAPSAAANQRQAAIEMLLKPMRGELTVEAGQDFAMKGLRTDVAFQQPAADVDLLQNLVEQGKQIAAQLPEGEADLADALGIRLAGDDGDTAVPVSRTESGNLLLDALTDEAVTAPTAGEDVTDHADRAATGNAEGAQSHSDEVLHGAFSLGKTEGVGAVATGEGPRAQQAVMQQVIDKVKELTPGPAQVRMVLNPESLGQVTIRLIAHRGDVSVRIITDSPEAHKLLDGGMNHLKAALADSGIKLDQATVVHVPQQERQESQQQRQQQPQPDQQGQEARHEASPEELAALEELTALLQGRGEPTG
jgi:flagellar hook-length control protein FliK